MFDNEKLGMRPSDGSPRLTSPSRPKIALRSVRSLPHSSPPTNSHYALLLYHIDNYAPQEPGCQQYEQLVSTLSSIEATLPFRSAHELSTKTSTGSKTLVLTGTNQLSQQTLKQAGPLPNCDLLFLGELRPGRQLLAPSVVMAANEAGPLLSFIRAHGFDCQELKQEEHRLERRHSISSTDFRNLMHKLMREDSEYSSNNNIFRSTFRSNSPPVQKATMHWTVDHDPASPTNFLTSLLPSSSPKTNRPDFSPTVSPFSSSQPNWRESSSKQGAFSSSYTDRFHYEDQGVKKEEEAREEVWKKEEEEEVGEAVQSAEKGGIQPMFWYEKKQYVPSKIINEVSEEYQLSRPSSIVDARNNQLESIRLTRNRLLDNSLQLNSNLNKQPSLPELPVSHSINTSSKSPRVLKKTIPETPFEVREEVINENIVEVTAGSATKEGGRKDVRKRENPIIARTIQRQGTLNNQIKPGSPRELKGRTPKATVQNFSEQPVTETPKENHQIQETPKHLPTNAHLLNNNPTERQLHGPVKKVHQQRQESEAVSPRQPDKPKQVIPSAFHHSLARQFEGFERIEKDGVVIYRRKTDQSPPAPLQAQLQVQPKFQQQPGATPLKPNSSQALLKETYSPKPSGGSDQKSTRNMLEVRKNLAVRPANNESMTMSRLSELHSDGSILRRNNMRFGVKVKEKPEASMIWQESRLLSGLGIGAKAEGQERELSRLLVGEEVIENEKQKCNHIVTAINNFHFLVHEELSYFVPLLQQLLSQNDALEVFASLEELFEIVRPEQVEERFDGGFIFTLSSHLPLLNPKILPRDYFLSIIDPSQGPLLEFSPGSRKLRIDHLKRLLLAESLVLEGKLFQCVLYRSSRPEIRKLAEMLGTELNAEKVDGEWKAELLENYYSEFPRLTRLYLLLEEEEITQAVQQINLYQANTPSFRPLSCKLLCLLTNILPHDQLILSHPTVTFLNNPENLSSPLQVLHYAHYHQEPGPTLALDYLHYPHSLSQLPAKLQAAFPGRFQFGEYRRVGEAVSRAGKGKGSHYLVLGEGSGLQKIGGNFRRVFGLGKGGIQSSMVRVLNLEELIEQLRYY